MNPLFWVFIVLLALAGLIDAAFIVSELLRNEDLYRGRMR